MKGQNISERLNERVKIYLAVVVGYGLNTPDGCLPVYSVGTEEEDQQLLVLVCDTLEASTDLGCRLCYKPLPHSATFRPVNTW